MDIEENREKKRTKKEKRKEGKDKERIPWLSCFVVKWLHNIDINISRKRHKLRILFFRKLDPLFQTHFLYSILWHLILWIPHLALIFGTLPFFPHFPSNYIHFFFLSFIFRTKIQQTLKVYTIVFVNSMMPQNKSNFW